jgi:phospholipase C
MPSPNPIEHVVIIVKENHTFDNYFATFKPAASSGEHVEGMALTNQAPNPVPPHDFIEHEYWVKRKVVNEQFTEHDIPSYFAYAKQYTLCDNYFSDVAGASAPNHLMLLTAHSPIIDNPPRDPVTQKTLIPTGAPFPLMSLAERLDQNGLTWWNYGEEYFNLIKGVQGRNCSDPNENKFATDAADSQKAFPNVSWVCAPHEKSEHPQVPDDQGNPDFGNVTTGMQWTVDQVTAIVQGGHWHNTAIFITWDDWGGWYDHVSPPPVEKWKHDPNHPDWDRNKPKMDGTQFRFGPRVPCLVLSPYAKPGHVSHKRYSHVSLIKFCERIFGLEPLKNPMARDEDPKDDGMADCFDFNQPALPQPA